MRAGKKAAAVAAGAGLAAVLFLSGCEAKYTPEDAMAYVECVLDASYRGELDKYVELTDSTMEEARNMYQQNIDNVMEGTGIESLGLPEELKEQYREMAPELLALAKYEVTGAEEEENGFAVQVSIEPFSGYQDLEDELVSALEEEASGMTEMPDDAAINEMVYRNMFEILRDELKDPAYNEPQEYTIHVTEDDNHMYEVSEQELIDMDYAMFPG